MRLSTASTARSTVYHQWTCVSCRPLEEPFVRKWQLACEGDIAHVVVMPNITITKLEEFVQVSVELVCLLQLYVCADTG